MRQGYPSITTFSGSMPKDVLWSACSVSCDRTRAKSCLAASFTASTSELVRAGLHAGLHALDRMRPQMLR